MAVLTYNDASFNAEIDVLMEPYFDTRLSLEELEDQELYKRVRLVLIEDDSTYNWPDHKSLQFARLIFLH